MNNQTDKKNIKRKNMHPLPQENQKPKTKPKIYTVIKAKKNISFTDGIKKYIKSIISRLLRFKGT